MTTITDILAGIEARSERAVRVAGLLLEAQRGVDNHLLLAGDGAAALSGHRLRPAERAALVRALHDTLQPPQLPPIIALWALGKAADEDELHAVMAFLERVVADPACSLHTHQALMALTGIGGPTAEAAARLVAAQGSGEPAAEAREYLAVCCGEDG